MKNLIYLVLGVIIAFVLQAACNNSHPKNYNNGVQVDPAGLAFIHDGLEGGLTEIKASGLVIINSNNQRVISFAKMLIDDHTKANDDLTKIETDKQVAEKDTISADHQKMISDLSKKSGAAFDKAYVQMMIADHEQAIKLFTTASQNTDAEISKFASATLPTLKAHLDSANAISASLK